MTAKTQVKLYENGIQSFGAPITLGQFKAMLRRCKAPDNTVLVGFGDEEGNQLGTFFEIIYDEQAGDLAEEYNSGISRDTPVITFTPAI
jgi:hypothetical protein